MNNSTKDIRGYNDKVFKAIFSTEKGKILLKKLLKDYLGQYKISLIIIVII